VPFPTSLGTFIDGVTVIHGTDVSTLQDIVVGPAWYNVKAAAYGAVGDGVTDDTSALLAAIAAAPAGSVIYFPHGTYITNSALVVTVNNLWFDGPGTIKLKDSANHAVIRFHGVTGGGVRNIGIDGNKANNTGGDGFGNQGVQMGDDLAVCTNVAVLNARITNTLNDGVYIKLGLKCRVEGCYITNCGTDLSGGSPVHILQGAVDCEVMHNLCDSNAYGINVESNNVSNCLRTRIIGNVVSNCSGAHGGFQQAGAISIQGATYTVIQGNHCYGAPTIRGIYLAPGYSASSSDYALIEGNICNSNAGHNGIDLTGNFLKVIGNHSENNGQSGIFLSGNPLPIDTTNCILVGNTCRNNGTLLGAGSTSQAGIVMNFTVPGDITDNLIVGNSCLDNGTGSQLYGILQWTGPGSHYARNVIANNQLKGNATAPISLLSTSDVVRDNSGANPHIRQAPAFAASFTPDLSLGDYIAIGALTAGITINNFAANQLYPAQIITLQFTQDGTGGRAVTWNAAFKTAWQPLQQANSISEISFQYDGTNWQQLNGLATDQLGNVAFQGLTDLRNANTAAGLLPNTGNTGDKIALYGTSYGIGIQAGRFVFYGAAFGFRGQAGGAGQQSAGTEVFVIDGAGHLISTVVGAPATSNLGTNVTSATFTGNDVRGTIAIVMAGALAANTRVCTATFATSYGATAPKVTLVDQTSAVGLTIVNSYVQAQSTGVSFDIAFDQALASGTYTIDYIVIG